MADVIIKSKKGTNPAMSDSNGNFTLTFKDQDYGALVYLEAEKKGYEVVNEKAMQIFLPDAKENQIMNLDIILCKEGYLEQARIKYYKITDKYIKAEYQKRYDQITAQKEEGWQKERAQLNEQMDKLKEQLRTEAEDYIRTNLDELSEKELETYQNFKKILLIAIKEKEKEKTNSSIKSDVNNIKSLTETYIHNLEYEKAQKIIENALQIIDNSDEDTMWFNRKLPLVVLYQGKFNESKEIYMRLKIKPYGDATYKEVFLADLEALEKEGITHPDVAKIRKLLNHD